MISQHLPVKEEGGQVEISPMRNGCFGDTLTIVDIHEFVKIGGKCGWDLRRNCS